MYPEPMRLTPAVLELLRRTGGLRTNGGRSSLPPSALLAPVVLDDLGRHLGDLDVHLLGDLGEHLEGAVVVDVVHRHQEADGLADLAVALQATAQRGGLL